MSTATGFTQYRTGEFAADRFIHMTGTLAGVVGSAMLVGIAGVCDLPIFSASLVYAISLVAMLGCSAAYNLPPTHPDEGFCGNLIMPRSF